MHYWVWLIGMADQLAPFLVFMGSAKQFETLMHINQFFTNFNDLVVLTAPLDA